MKTLNWMLVALTAGTLAFAGCSKSAKTEPPKISGVTVDMPKLTQALAGAPAEVQAELSQAAFGLRYGDNMKALMSLDKIVNHPSLTEPQKKVTNEVIEQVKQVVNQASAKPAQ